MFLAGNVKNIAQGETLPEFLAYKLHKRYTNLIAVNEVTFSVKKSQCFGLLGVNGAGKSTTFKLITGESVANDGLMFVNDKDLVHNRKSVR